MQGDRTSKISGARSTARTRCSSARAPDTAPSSPADREPDLTELLAAIEPIERGGDVSERKTWSICGFNPLSAMKPIMLVISERLPNVEPNTCNCLMKRRRRSAEGSSPVVAPQVMRRPPRTSERIAADQTALPTFSITTSTPPIPGKLHDPIDDGAAADVLDCLGRAERPRPFELLGLARGDDRPRPERARDLSGRERNRASNPENEDRVTGLKARFGRDHAPGGEPGDAERGRLDEVEQVGLAHDASGRRAHELSERAVDLLAEDAPLRAQNLLALSAELACLAGLTGIDDDRITD